MAKLDIDTKDYERLMKAFQNYPGTVEDAVNEVLHNQASPILQESIQNLIPVSTRKPWKGKAPHAKESKSLRDLPENLAITIRTAKRYQYLYFPDDGSNTRRHIGNQQFFLRGAEAKQSEIIDLCINRLVGDLEKSL